MAQEATNNTQNNHTTTAEKSIEKLPLSANLADNNFVSSDADNFINKIGRSEKRHCVKSVQIRSYVWSVFSCIRTEYANLRIQPKYRKILTRNNSVFGHFSHSEHAKKYRNNLSKLQNDY